MTSPKVGSITFGPAQESFGLSLATTIDGRGVLVPSDKLRDMQAEIERLRALLAAVTEEYDNVLFSEFGTGKPDPKFAEKWPALKAALDFLAEGR